MVKPATALGRTGLQDWIIQRATAIILAVYTAYLFIYFITHSNFNYEAWHTLFTYTWMRYATLLALLSLIAHAWIGIWTVTTDYIKPLWLRLSMHSLVILALLLYVVWGVHIIWGV